MADHLLVETYGVWAGPGCHRFVADAVAITRAGHSVSLFLIEDGVTAALSGQLPIVDELIQQGGTVLVDQFSLRQRALDKAELTTSVRPVEIETLAVKILEPNVQAVWH